MNKYFLLIAGDNYYPSSGCNNWISTFFTEEEALSVIEIIEHKRTITKGKRKGEEELEYTTYKINGHIYDWYTIVNLEYWIKPCIS